jgi:hypothetical protein
LIKWSFSGLKDYVNCPRQYHETKVTKNFVKKQTEQMLYGTEVHKALEDYVRDGTPLLKNYERYQPMLDSLLEIEGGRYPEHKMALRDDKTPCDFTDKDYWVRGIVDLLVVDGDSAYIVDYKTGSAKYPDSKQLKLMALMTYAHFPRVNQIKAGLLFVAHNTFIAEEYRREQISSLWENFTPELARLKWSYEQNRWPENPTPLCGWCPVTTCQFQRIR